MRRTSSWFTTTLAVGLLTVLGMGLLAGCGGPDDADVTREMNLVTVNWIEGMAMTYMQEQILENRYDMTVTVNEVQGGGIAFSSVASGKADFFNEAWLPTTHEGPWGDQKDQLQKLGYTYRGTTAGLTVPAYMDVGRVSELGNVRGALDGKIHGIESGANLNDQARQTLENNDVEGFSVVAASGPATWRVLQNAVENEEPIVVTGWQPHWKWSEFDLKYLEGAQTGQTDVFGAPEDIFTIVGKDFADRFPREVVCFLQEFEVTDEQVGSLMFAFKDRGDTSRQDAMRQWIENNPEHVERWVNQAEACAASDEPIEYLPDDAIHSASPST